MEGRRNEGRKAGKIKREMQTVECTVESVKDKIKF